MHASREGSRNTVMGLRVLSTLAVIAGLLLVVRGLIFEARNSAKRSACIGRLCKLTMALNNYYLRHGTFPPAYVEGAEGRRMHSWRVLVRPYFYDLSESEWLYDFQLAWDDPSNTVARSKRCEEWLYLVFLCPSNDRTLSEGVTNYVAIVGKDTLWPGPTGYTPSSKYDFAYGSNEFAPGAEAFLEEMGEPDRILLIELPDSHIRWTEPRDISIDEAVQLYRERKDGKYRSRHIHYITLSGKHGDILDIPDESTFRAMCDGTL